MDDHDRETLAKLQKLKVSFKAQVALEIKDHSLARRVAHNMLQEGLESLFTNVTGRISGEIPKPQLLTTESSSPPAPLSSSPMPVRGTGVSQPWRPYHNAATSASGNAPPGLPTQPRSSDYTYTGKQPRQYLFDTPSGWPELRLAFRSHPISLPDSAAGGDVLLHLLCSRLERYQREIRSAEARNHEQILYLGFLRLEMEAATRAVNDAQLTLEQATETSDIERLRAHLTTSITEKEAAEKRLHEQLLYSELLQNEIAETAKAAREAQLDVARADVALRCQGIPVVSDPHSYKALKTVNELYKEGKFKRFGISNFMSWEVAEVVAICKANGFIEPTVYQRFGIAFYAFNPLGGGFFKFTGRYTGVDSETPGGTRFDPKTLFGQAYRHRYWNDTYFTALQSIQAVGDNHGLTLAEIALRWVSRHSLMKPEQGDAVIIGASSLAHIEQNLVDLEKGPLPEDVVKALDDAWASVKGVATNYFH
ncbi:Aldo-keto reductase [Mycena chlorophos]|uniref:Aldo-keto reductase n=1 Tax=Mycena chlorophos TaxID=658473 RepID=A0A8H6SE84_MYCCL|nr:Aldo-keto reductase [Mycena chlorophos]